MNRWSNDTDRKNHSAQTTPISVPIHLVKKKSHMEWPEVNPGLCDECQVTAWSMTQLLNGCFQYWTNIVSTWHFNDGWTDPWQPNFVEWCLIFFVVSFSPLRTEMCISSHAPNRWVTCESRILGLQLSNLIHVAFLVLRIWSWALGFWKVFGPHD
jgi:hypothetical protein